MQTLEFTRALEEIVKELKINEIVAILLRWLPVPTPNAAIPEPEKDKFQALVLSSHSGYDHLMLVRRTRTILEKLQLDELYDAARWRRLVVSLSSAPNTHTLRTVSEWYALYEALRSLLRLQTACKDLLETAKVGKLDPSDGILELEIVDYDGTGIGTDRLIRIVVTVTNLYNHLSRVLDVHDSKLTFKYFDSGSGFLLGILGGKSVIESMSNVIFQWWDKIKFRDYDTFDRRMNAVSKSLTVMTTVTEAVANGVIDPETGENMKRRICQETDRLIGLGATLPLKETTEIDERTLLIEKRDTKLLGTGLPSGFGEEEPDKAGSS